MGKKGKKKLENGIFQQKRRDFEQFSENAIFFKFKKICKNKFFINLVRHCFVHHSGTYEFEQDDYELQLALFLYE
jgi:hypothetical protein